MKQNEEILGSEIMANAFSTSELDGHGTWSAPCCKRITPGKRNPADHWTVGWVDFRNSVDIERRKIFLPLPGNNTPLFQPIT
jgi:hypothetical protein